MAKTEHQLLDQQMHQVQNQQIVFQSNYSCSHGNMAIHIHCTPTTEGQLLGQHWLQGLALHQLIFCQ
jgi:hypothetical protein